MKYLGIFLSLIVFASVVPAKVSAAGCEYGSTQARVQKSSRDPWASEITVVQGEYFRVGSFHNGSDQYARDTILTSISSTGNQAQFRNGFRIRPMSLGTYRLVVTTKDQSGPGCEAQALVHVVAAGQNTPDPTPSSQTCSYGSTQARVQKDINDSWSSREVIALGGYFNIGSFHNQTGQFASDTQIFINAPSGKRYGPYANATRLRAGRAGNYTIEVITKNQAGASCSDKAVLEVRDIPELSY